MANEASTDSVPHAESTPVKSGNRGERRLPDPLEEVAAGRVGQRNHGDSSASPAPSDSNSQATFTPSFRDLRTDQGATSTFSFMHGPPSALEQERIQASIEDLLLNNLSIANAQKEAERNAKQAREREREEVEARVSDKEVGRASPKAAADRVSPASPPSSFALPFSPAFDPSDLLSFFKSGMEVIVQDGFSRCFESSRSQPWNWNLYLWPLWACGVVIRYGILFPLRLISLLTGFIIVLLLLGISPFLPLPRPVINSWQRKLIRFLCGVFVFSWTGVIKYHGTIPAKRPNQIYVANHTSMIDVVVLSQMHTFSLVGQKHPGWVGWLQTNVLGIIGAVWFQRGEADDRVKSAKKMKAHVADPKNNRLLVFPEGTCVNNVYCVQFKQGVFAMDCEICPIAIKYNRIFVDAFWNSKKQSFQAHLATLMCSWALVCDVYYLEPQRIQPGESSIAFSNRVKKLIADKAGLRNVSYDGYLKHFEVKQSLVQKQQKMYADVILKRLSAQEKEEIEREEREDERKKAALDAATNSPTHTHHLHASTAAPDSLSFSPSPDVSPITRNQLHPVPHASHDPPHHVSSAEELTRLIKEQDKSKQKQ